MILVCAIRDDHAGEAGAEIQLWRAGEFLCGQRMPSRKAALKEAADWRAMYLNAGGVLLPEDDNIPATGR